MITEVKRIGTRDQLERALDAIVTQATGGIALAAMNLTTGETVSHNGDRPMPTASVFKLPLLVEVFRQAECGLLNLDERVEVKADDLLAGSGILRDLGPGLKPTLRDLATLMIVVSDNSASNLLLDRAGGPERVNATMRDLGLASIMIHRRIAFGTALARGSVAEAAPNDLMHLAGMLARDELVSPAACRAMKAILARQRHLDQASRFIAYQPHASDPARRERIRVFNKTGMSQGLRADTGIIELQGDVVISYSVVNNAGADDSYRNEHPGDITNALVGRILVEYWWPGAWVAERAVWPSPYVDDFFAAAGL